MKNFEIYESTIDYCYVIEDEVDTSWEIPDELYDRYFASMAEFEKVQKELESIYNQHARPI